MSKLQRSACLALLGLGLSTSVFAQIISASLEYSSTAPVKIFINGVEARNPESADGHFTDYALICSADGAFPLGALRYGQPNVLAISQKNLMRSPAEVKMMLSYCLTLRDANGQVTRVIGRPQNSKCLFMHANQAVAPDWAKPGFNDAEWKAPQNIGFEAESFSLAENPDPEGSGPLRFLAKDFTGQGQMGDSLYFRQAFNLAPLPGKLRVYSYQAAPKRGDKPALALIPDKNCAGMGALEISAVLPQGLEPVIAPGIRWQPAPRKLVWAYPSPAKSVALHLASVLENKGFEAPQVALGPWRTNRAYKDQGPLGEEYWHSTDINSGTSAWYKLSAPPAFVDGPAAPVILGVAFQSQVAPGGYKGALSRDGVDDLLLNYSVDGTQQGALAKDANLSRFGGSIGLTLGHSASMSTNLWLNGYYVADTDRVWTWKDLANLKVRLQAVQHGQRHRSKLLSLIASVSYYQPADVMPRFFVQVSEAAKKTLRIAATARSVEGNGEAGGFLDLAVNP